MSSTPARHYYHKDIEVKRFALVHPRQEISYLPDAGFTVRATIVGECWFLSLCSQLLVTFVVAFLLSSQVVLLSGFFKYICADLCGFYW